MCLHYVCVCLFIIRVCYALQLLPVGMSRVCCAVPPTLRKQHLPCLALPCWSSCPGRSSSHAPKLTGIHSFIHLSERNSLELTWAIRMFPLALFELKENAKLAQICQSTSGTIHAAITRRKLKGHSTRNSHVHFAHVHFDLSLSLSLCLCLSTSWVPALIFCGIPCRFSVFFNVG